MPYNRFHLNNSLHVNAITMTRHFITVSLIIMGFAIADIRFAYADSRNSAHFGYPIDFALTFSNSEIDLREGNNHYPVNLERINVSIFSLQDDDIQFGFNTGSSFLNFDDDNVLAGVSLNGYHTGLAVQSQYGNNPQFGLRADYRYQETRNKTASQSATLSWHEWSVAATGKLILDQQFGLLLGWSYSEINARRRTQGDINSALSMRLDSPQQTQLGLEWMNGTGGQISIVLQNGAYENIAFSFAQTFK